MRVSTPSSAAAARARSRVVWSGRATCERGKGRRRRSGGQRQGARRPGPRAAPRPPIGGARVLASSRSRAASAAAALSSESRPLRPTGPATRLSPSIPKLARTAQPIRELAVAGGDRTAPSAAPPGLVTPREKRVIAPMASSGGSPSSGARRAPPQRPRSAGRAVVGRAGRASRRRSRPRGPLRRSGWRRPRRRPPRARPARPRARPDRAASPRSRRRARRGSRPAQRTAQATRGAREGGHRHEAPLPGERCEGERRAGGPIRHGHAPEAPSELDRTGAAVGVVARRLRARVSAP